MKMHKPKMPEACPSQHSPEQSLTVLFQQYVPALQMEPAQRSEVSDNGSRGVR